MLTVDDLDHFSDARLAHLFATPGSQQDPDQLARLARIVACLKFCSHLPDAQLLPGGGHAAQTLLRQALRSQRRGQLDGDGLAQSLETVLALLGAAADKHRLARRTSLCPQRLTANRYPPRPASRD